MNDRQPEVQPMGTPNPRSVKFVTDRTVLARGSADFQDPEAARRSGLALALFDLEGVRGVFLSQNFVTVTVNADGLWGAMAPRVAEVIRDYLASGKDAVEGGWEEDQPSESEIETRIREILDKQIRPAVAMDGGDVVFVEYEDGVVRLRMQGACGSCPSSTATLKLGIEARLRHFIPQIQRVEAV